MFSTIKVLTTFLFILLTNGHDLPESFEKCKRNDPNFDKCLVGAVNKALVILKDGNEEFHIEPLEPMDINKLEMESGRGPISMKQVFNNVKVYDMIGSSKVLKYTTDLDKHMIVCDSKSDRINVIGDYEMSGRLLLLPITGKGKANLTLIDTLIQHKLIGEPYMKDGEKYMKLKEYRVDFRPKRVWMQFDNLFNGDRILSDNMNRFINENWEIVFNELKPGYQKNFGKIFRNITNKMFTKVPMDKIFLK